MEKNKEFLFKPKRTDIYTIRLDINSPNTEANFSNMSIIEIGNPITNITLDIEKTFIKGQTGTQNLNAKFNTTDTQDEIEYTSSNTTIATVDGKGNVTAVGEGQAVITAKAKYSGVSAISTINVVNENQVPSKNLIAKSDNLTSKTDTKIDYVIENDNNTETFFVTPKVSSGDSFGYVGRKVYLEAGKNYVFNCEIENGVKWSIENKANCVEAWLVRNGNASDRESLIRIANQNCIFTPKNTGEYWLRLDVNEPIISSPKTYKFKNIEISKIGDIKPTNIKLELYKNQINFKDYSIQKTKLENTEIEFDKTENIYELKTVITPANAITGEVSYISINKNVVDVDKDGKLKIKSQGTATIIVSAFNGAITGSIGITVVPSTKITEISFYTEKDYKTINGKRILMGDVNGDGILTADDASRVLQHVLDSLFELDVEEAAYVEGDEVLSAAESTMILEKVLDNLYIFPCFKITSLDLGINQTQKLNITAYPSGVSVGNITWSSNNNAVATVDDNGNVKGISPGTAVITARSTQNNSISRDCTITVGNYKVEPEVSVSENKESDKTEIKVKSNTTDSKDNAYIKSVYLEITGTTYSNGQIKYNNQTKDLVKGETKEKLFIYQNDSNNNTIKNNETNFDITAEGSYEIAITVTDSQGKSKTEIINIIRDVTRPIVQFKINNQDVQDRNTYNFNEKGVQIHAEATDNESGINYLELIVEDVNDGNIYDDSFHDTPSKHDFVIKEPGEYSIKCSCADNGRNAITINAKVIIKSSNSEDGIHIYTDSEYLTVDGEKHLIGDVNKDGIITNEDHLLVELYVLDASINVTFDEVSADVNGDGIITAADAAEINEKITDPYIIFEALYQNSATMNVGEELQLYTDIKPIESRNKTVLWTVDDSSIVRIDNKGKITALKPGIAVINAQTSDGAAQTKFNVTVLDNVKPPMPTIILNGQKAERDKTYTFNDTDVKIEIPLPEDIGSGTDCIEFGLRNETTDTEIYDSDKSNKDISITIDEEGEYYLWAAAIDKAGNVSQNMKVTIIVKKSTNPDNPDNPEEEYFRILNYKQDGNYVMKILPETTYSKFKENIDTNMEYEVLENNEKITDSQLIKTGQTLVVNSKNTGESTRYTLIVIGDINKDGKLSITDLSNFRRYRIGKMQLDESQRKATDMNLNGREELTDKLIMRNYLIGKIKNLV